jgi:hypothetical protein
MSASVDEIRRANKEFYCDTYSISSRYRTLNVFFAMGVMVLLGVSLFCVKKTSQLFAYIQEAGRDDTLGSMEVKDWVMQKMWENLFDGLTVLFIFVTILSIGIVIFMFKAMKSYELYKKSGFMIFLGIVYASCFLVILLQCTWNQFLFGAIVTFLEAAYSIPAFKLLLPSELKAPFDNVMGIFDCVAKLTIKKM